MVQSAYLAQTALCLNAPPHRRPAHVEAFVQATFLKNTQSLVAKFSPCHDVLLFFSQTPVDVNNNAFECGNFDNTGS
jgi:hypothetical protein